MATALLERVPVDRVEAQARQVRFGRTLLALVTGVFYVLGWVTYKTFALMWLAVAWAALAVREGWRDARKAQRGPGRAG